MPMREKILEQRPQRPISRSKTSVLPEPAESGPIADLLAFDPDISQGKTLRDLEMGAIQSSLQRNEGNKAKAADELGISLKTLYNKLNQTFDGKKTG